MTEHSENEQTYDLSLLNKSEHTWVVSRGLRIVYGSIYRDINKRLVEGPSLELGSGIGGIKTFIPEIVTSDLVKTSYVDMVCSAYEIPLANPENGENWSNIIAIDVLHHLCRPIDFFRSANAALREKGRIILVEPAGTVFGKLFYRLFHPEPVSPREITPPFVFEPAPASGEFANMGMAISMFVKYRSEVDLLLEGLGLKLTEIVFRDVLAYPFTGGYSSLQMLPASWIKFLLGFEKKIPLLLMRWLALRMLVVIEKL